MANSMKQNILRFVGRQEWLRGRDRVLRTFSHPDRQKSHAFETDFFGQPYTGNMANFIDWSVFYYGAFALHEVRLLAAIADALRANGKPVNFFDVGANIGHHTLFMSRHADRVFSFEPFHVVRNEMARKLNHANASNVTIFPVALGDRNGTGSFHPPTGANQGTGTLGDNLPGNASAETIPVQVARGDDFFAANQLPPISLLKMDVEGFEAKVLEGLRETIWRDRPPIFMEIQHEHLSGSESHKGATVKELLYPDHLIFEVGSSRDQYTLKPFLQGNTEEALVLPIELAGLVRDSGAY
ncbi:FkbM family methyltransferase [Edaphobacter aggregans]|uniref:FkbM family methyltransferase n=2 Tax=Edaphobacter aggregans TaxID=570835 RepID=A0A3R9QHF1_9BACT|nr:FkbM family methyltransferase [Edaphobacter aggregans]